MESITDAEEFKNKEIDYFNKTKKLQIEITFILLQITRRLLYVFKINLHLLLDENIDKSIEIMHKVLFTDDLNNLFNYI